MHKSVSLNTPCEFINVTPVNPLISKCQIKVCYVGETQNRNQSIITKEVATEMANSLPGCPIVGFFNTEKGDFEQHEKLVTMPDGSLEIVATTKPYGFVDLNAKVWFQHFIDDDMMQREYLVTEGYLWTGHFPETQGILEGEGNNQSMELDRATLKGDWTRDSNGKRQFFIINEAIMSKLCILGKDNEPCFEGASITKIQFSLEDSFKQELSIMMKQLKDFLNEGGLQMFTTYAIEIGDALWNSLYTHLEKLHPIGDGRCGSVYQIEGMYEEGEQKFAVVQHREFATYYRLNFTLDEVNGVSFDDIFIEVTKTYSPANEPQFSATKVAEFEQTYAEKKKLEAEKKSDEISKTTSEKSEGNIEASGEMCSECGKAITECACAKKKKKDYKLEEIPEYVDLQQKYSVLTAEKDDMAANLGTLIKFKERVDLESKKNLIKDFYMLSDEDKSDVFKNINSYSLEDIESKLSIMCVRNKVSFDKENTTSDSKNPIVYNLNCELGEDVGVPAWIKAVESVANRYQ